MEYLSATAYSEELGIKREVFVTYTDAIGFTKYNGKEITEKGYKAGLVKKSFSNEQGKEIEYTAYPIGVIDENDLQISIW